MYSRQTYLQTQVLVCFDVSKHLEQSLCSQEQFCKIPRLWQRRKPQVKAFEGSVATTQETGAQCADRQSPRCFRWLADGNVCSTYVCVCCVVARGLERCLLLQLKKHSAQRIILRIVTKTMGLCARRTQG